MLDSLNTIENAASPEELQIDSALSRYLNILTPGRWSGSPGSTGGVVYLCLTLYGCRASWTCVLPGREQRSVYELSVIVGDQILSLPLERAPRQFALSIFLAMQGDSLGRLTTTYAVRKSINYFALQCLRFPEMLYHYHHWAMKLNTVELSTNIRAKIPNSEPNLLIPCG